MTPTHFPDDFTHVLYHGPRCADGFAAAWAAWRKLGQRARYLPIRYGKEADTLEKVPAGARVLFVDFSLKAALWEKVLPMTGRVAVIDHHATAADECWPLTDPEGPHRFVFALPESGATLTFQTLFPGHAMPPLLAYVKDRDLWRWELPYSREVSLAVASYEWDFELWDAWIGAGQEAIDRLAGEGVVLRRAQLRRTAEKVRTGQVWTASIGGYTIPVCNTTVEMSEVAEALLEAFPKMPFAAVYWDEAGRRRWALRSRKGEFDVSLVAKAHGGGGHAAAAGFEEPLSFADPVLPDREMLEAREPVDEDLHMQRMRRPNLIKQPGREEVPERRVTSSGIVIARR